MLTDDELWDRIRENDEQAFAQLFYRYSTRMYRRIYSFLGDPVLSEQIVHDIFLSLWSNRTSLQIRSFKAYLTSASYYAMYKSSNASKLAPISYRENIAESTEGFSDYKTENEALGYFAREAVEMEINTYLRELPKRCREIFILSRQEYLSNDEIAEKLGVSKRTVENQLTFALRHLRISLREVSVIWLVLYSLI